MSRSGRSCLLPFIAIFGGFGLVFAFVFLPMMSNLLGHAAAAITIPTMPPFGSSSIATDPTVVADLGIMHAGLDARIAKWEATSDNIVHHVSASDAGLPSNFNTKEVVYGHCATKQFYLFVLNITRPEDTTADTEGYEFVPGGTPSKCAPAGWHIMSIDTAAPDWYFITASTSAATAMPAATAAPAKLARLPPNNLPAP